MHAAIIQISQGVFKVSRFGLTGMQWGVCIGFGAICFLINIFIKFVPDKWFECLNCLNEIESVEDHKSVPIESVSYPNKNKINETEALYINNLNNIVKKSVSKERQASNPKVLSKSNFMHKQLSKNTHNMNNPNHKD